MINPKQELRDEIKLLAERCQLDQARYSQATSSILYGLAAALSCDNEERLCNVVADFAESQVRALTAERN